jgi:hypothetical protein
LRLPSSGPGDISTEGEVFHKGDKRYRDGETKEGNGGERRVPKCYPWGLLLVWVSKVRNTSFLKIEGKYMLTTTLISFFLYCNSYRKLSYKFRMKNNGIYLLNNRWLVSQGLAGHNGRKAGCNGKKPPPFLGSCKVVSAECMVT